MFKLVLILNEILNVIYSDKNCVYCTNEEVDELILTQKSIFI